MSILQNLVAASQLNESVLRQQARSRQAHWQSWLAPISDSQPTGSDPGYDDDFQRIREEVNKISGVDTELICQLAEKLLTQTCKDLRVITFYVWARLQRDGESGLAEGVTLLAAMLERFGAMLHPQRERSCKSALEWLGSRRMSDSLSLYPEVDMTTMQVIIGALLLTEASFAGLAEASRPDLFRAISDTGEPPGAKRRSPQPGAADQPRRTRSAAPTCRHRSGNAYRHVRS